MKNQLQITDNDDYLLVNFNALSEVAFLAKDILDIKSAGELCDEIGKIMYTIAFYDDYDINEFIINKNSILGNFILNPKREKYALSIDAYISEQDLFNAYTLACISKNIEMAKNIQTIINDNRFGFIAELKNYYNYYTLLYIYNSKSLNDFLINNVKDSVKRYFLYEDEHISVISSNKVYTLKL